MRAFPAVLCALKQTANFETGKTMKIILSMFVMMMMACCVHAQGAEPPLGDEHHAAATPIMSAACCQTVPAMTVMTPETVWNTRTVMVPQTVMEPTTVWRTQTVPMASHGTQVNMRPQMFGRGGRFRARRCHRLCN